jgi:hypothetical protein
MKEKELTAVEWLYQHLFPKQLDGFSEEEWSKIDVAFQQAKEMEKEQIMKTAIQSYNNCILSLQKSGDEYIEYAKKCYEETFKQQEQ